MVERLAERLWESGHPVVRLCRLALWPLSLVYGMVIAARNAAYNRGLLASRSLGLPTVSVGNITVGGTGKTPMAAWFARRVAEQGGCPAILLRGYGGDEAEVHRRTAPGAKVYAGANRSRSATEARAAGATALVLDDGFQHRGVRRDADVVIVSADRHRRVRLLPAGPWREPLAALRRATHVVVTRKGTSPLRAREVLGYVTALAPDVQTAIVHLAADRVVPWRGGPSLPVERLAGATVLAISGIGDPQAFLSQLRATSARVVARTFGDHHTFAAADAWRLAREAQDAQYVVCTLKDAVKLGPLWPPSAPPLWYLSQHVSIESGAEALESIVRSLARPVDL